MGETRRAGAVFGWHGMRYEGRENAFVPRACHPGASEHTFNRGFELCPSRRSSSIATFSRTPFGRRSTFRGRISIGALSGRHWRSRSIRPRRGWIWLRPGGRRRHRADRPGDGHSTPRKSSAVFRRVAHARRIVVSALGHAGCAAAVERGHGAAGCSVGRRAACAGDLCLCAAGRWARPAFYRYLPLEHQLLLEFEEPDAEAKIARAALDQEFVAQGAVVLYWTTMAYRMEWRYDVAAHKEIAMDAGHVCQNLYLACEAIGAARARWGPTTRSGRMRCCGWTGAEEFTIYLAPVAIILLALWGGHGSVMTRRSELRCLVTECCF